MTAGFDAFALAKYRQGKGLQQGDVARVLGVTRQAVNHWENGTRAPSHIYLPGLAELLDCQIGDLYTTAAGARQ